MRWLGEHDRHRRLDLVTLRSEIDDELDTKDVDDIEADVEVREDADELEEVEV